MGPKPGSYLPVKAYIRARKKETCAFCQIILAFASLALKPTSSGFSHIFKVRQTALWTEQLLDTQTFHWRTDTVELAGTKLISHSDKFSIYIHIYIKNIYSKMTISSFPSGRVGLELIVQPD